MKILLTIWMALGALVCWRIYNQSAPASRIITVNALDPCGRMIVGSLSRNDGFTTAPQCPQTPNQLRLEAESGTVKQLAFATWEVMLDPGQTDLMLAIHSVGNGSTKWNGRQNIKPNQPRTHALVQLSTEAE